MILPLRRKRWQSPIRSRSCFAAGLVSLALLGVSPSWAKAQSRFAIEIFLGTAASIELTGSYETRPFDQPLYYSFRLSLRSPNSAWELQFTHHKMYLSNPPPEVVNLEITHGFNILTANYAYEKLPVALRAGAGIVLPHVSGTVRGQDYESEGGIFGTGYHITGPALLVGAGRRFLLGSHFLLSVDGQLTAAWANVRVTGGSLSVSNVAVHLLAGVGYTF